jgi:hypothetical protein
MVLDTNGNLGIGTTTPNSLLTVGSNGQFAVDSSGNLTMNGGGALTINNPGSQGAIIQLQSGGSAFGYLANAGWWATDGTQDLAIIAGSGKGTKFFENGGGTPSMTITSGGNVGIGTTVQASKLDVNGNLAVGAGGGVSAPTNGMYVTGIAGIGTQYPYSGTQLTVAGANSAPTLSSNNSALLMLTTPSTGQLTFGTFQNSPYYSWIQTKDANNSGTAYPLALNPLGGNVGIGASSPGYKLEVAGGFFKTTFNTS